MISFVYFDLGGVAILDFSGTNKWSQLKSDLGLNAERLDIFNEVWKRYERDYDFCIDFDIDTLISIFEKEHGIKLPQEYSFLKDIVNRFEPNPSIWSVIEYIHQMSRIGLLTNVYPGMLDLIKNRNIMPPIKLDVEIDSSVVGLQKPQQKIFELAQETAKVKKDEILFVDNTEGHIEVAKNFGWKTCLYDSKNPIRSSNKLLQTFNEASQ